MSTLWTFDIVILEACLTIVQSKQKSGQQSALSLLAALNTGRDSRWITSITHMYQSSSPIR